MGYNRSSRGAFVSRKLEAAHYLHRRTGLTPMLRPPVRGAEALTWCGDQLIVGTSARALHAIHPVHGTRTLLPEHPGALALAADPRTITVFYVDGTWRRYDADGKPRVEGRHPLTRDVRIELYGDRMLVCGCTPGDRRAKLYEGDRKVLRVLLPDRAVAALDVDGIHLAQPVADHQLESVRVGPGVRFKLPAAGDARLVPSGPYIIGLEPDSVRVWQIDGTPKTQLRVHGVTAVTLTPDHRYLALGTRQGGVAVVDLEAPPQTTPDTVHVSDQPVRVLAFDAAGAWLASAADRVVVWSWDLR